MRGIIAGGVLFGAGYGVYRATNVGGLGFPYGYWPIYYGPAYYGDDEVSLPPSYSTLFESSLTNFCAQYGPHDNSLDLEDLWQQPRSPLLRSPSPRLPNTSSTATFPPSPSSRPP